MSEEQWFWLKDGVVVGQSGRWRAESWLNEGRSRGRHDLSRAIAPVIQPGAKKEVVVNEFGWVEEVL